MEAVTLEGEEAILMEQIRQSDQYDDPVVKALDVGELHSDEWHTQKEWFCIEAESMSQMTPSSAMTWCMHITVPQSLDTLDNGRH